MVDKISEGMDIGTLLTSQAALQVAAAMSSPDVIEIAALGFCLEAALVIADSSKDLNWTFDILAKAVQTIGIEGQRRIAQERLDGTRKTS